MPMFHRHDHSTYYEIVGTGEPLVFVCGLSADLQVWRFQIHELSRSHQVIVFDNRGAGRSSAPDEPYTIAQMAEDLGALLDHLGLPAVHLLGWSMGGVIAQSFALAHPSRVRRLLLLNSFAEPDGLLREAISNWMNVRCANVSDEQVARYAARLVFSPDLLDSAAALESIVQNMLANPHRQSLHGFLRQADALLDYVAPPDLHLLGGCAAVLTARHDRLTPPYLSEALAARLPGASLHVLPGAHSGFVEHPGAYNKAILGALSGAGSR